MKQNFKQTIHQRTDEELNRIAKDHHFYSATERQIAINELKKRNALSDDLAMSEKQISPPEKKHYSKRFWWILFFVVLSTFAIIDLITNPPRNWRGVFDEHRPLSATEKLWEEAAEIIPALINEHSPLITRAYIKRDTVDKYGNPTTIKLPAGQFILPTVSENEILRPDLSEENIEMIRAAINEQQSRPITAVYIEQEAVQNHATINGVTWAASNVDAPGTFATNPEDLGMLFQWNRRKEWETTFLYVEGWDSSTPTGSLWYAENDPCPEGWRVPTPQELHLLHEANSEWAVLNGIGGRVFGDAPNQIFLPAAGVRFDNGRFNRYDFGGYWSNSDLCPTYARNLHLSGRTVDMTTSSRASGFSVRCVAKN